MAAFVVWPDRHGEGGGSRAARGLGCVALVTRYAQHMLSENGISEAIQFFHLDALSAMVGLKVDFDLQLTLRASSLYRLRAAKHGHAYERVRAQRLFRNLLDLSATVSLEAEASIVILDRRAHNPYMVASGLPDRPTPMPRFGGRHLYLRFARLGTVRSCSV